MCNVKNNFGVKVSCPICYKENDSQEHMFTCEKLNETSEIFDYNTIFSNNSEQFTRAAQMCRKFYRKREKLIKEKHTTETNHVHNAITL